MLKKKNKTDEFMPMALCKLLKVKFECYNNSIIFLKYSVSIRSLTIKNIAANTTNKISLCKNKMNTFEIMTTNLSCETAAFKRMPKCYFECKSSKALNQRINTYI